MEYRYQPPDVGLNLHRFGDREILAVVVAAFIGIVIPVVILSGSLLVAAWLDIVGYHNIHMTVWGWLTDFSRDKNGQPIYDVSHRVWQFYVGIVSVWLVYQFSELCAFGFRSFRDALSREATK